MNSQILAAYMAAKRKEEEEKEKEEQKKNTHARLSQEAHENLTQKQTQTSNRTSAYDTLTSATSSQRFDDANMLEDTGDKQLATGDTDTTPMPYKNPIETGNSRLDRANQEFLNQLDLQRNVLYDTALEGAGKLLDFGANVNKLNSTLNPVLNINNIKAEDVIRYQNGDRDVWAQLSFTRLKNSAEAKQVPFMAVIVDEIGNGKYKGSAEQLQKEIANSRNVLYTQQYNRNVEPFEQTLQSERQSNIQQYGKDLGGFMNLATNTAGTIGTFALTRGAGAAMPIAGAVTGLSHDTSSDLYRLRQGENVSNLANDTVVEGVKGAIFGKLFELASPLMNIGITPETTGIARLGISGLSGLLTGALISGGTQALDILKNNPNFDFIDWSHVERGMKDGEYRNLQDYLNSYEFEQDLLKGRGRQALFTGLATAIGNMIRVSQNPNIGEKRLITQSQAKASTSDANRQYALKVLGLKDGATEEEINAAWRNLAKVAHPDVGGSKEAMAAINNAKDILLGKNPGTTIAPTTQTPTSTDIVPQTNAPSTSTGGTTTTPSVNVPPATMPQTQPQTSQTPTTYKDQEDVIDVRKLIEHWVSEANKNNKPYIDNMREKLKTGQGATEVIEDLAEENGVSPTEIYKDLGINVPYVDKQPQTPAEEPLTSQNIDDTIDYTRGGLDGSGNTQEDEGIGENDTSKTGLVSPRSGVQQETNQTDNKRLQDLGKTSISGQYPIRENIEQGEDNGTNNTSNNSKLQRTTINNRLKHKKYVDWENEAYVASNGEIITFKRYKDEIVNSLSMKDATDMFKRAFATEYSISSPKYADYKEWLSKADPSVVAKAVLKNGLLKTKYIYPSKALKENPQLLRGVVGAYKNGELVGDTKELKYGDIDKTREGKFAANSYKYEPKDPSRRRGANELLEAAKSPNEKEASEAKAEFIINAHNPSWLKKSGMSQAKANELIESWGVDYSKKANQTIKEVNSGVSEYNSWTGIENSNIVNAATVTLDDLRNMGLTIKEEDVEAHPDLLKYIANTILATDTHQSWHGLYFLIETDKFNQHVRGELLKDHKTIDIYLNGPQTVSHEMGHWLDYNWGKEIALRWLNIPDYDFLTRRLDYDFLEMVSPFEEATNFIKHFYSFMDDISKTANLSSEYLQREQEIFARFFAEFIKWTSNLAGNNIMENDINIVDPKEKFTVKQFKEFVKLLQEKSAVASIINDNPKTAYNEFERQLSYGNNGDKVSDFLKEEFEKSKTPEEFLENIAKEQEQKLSNKLSKLIVDDKWFKNSFERVYYTLSTKGISKTNPYLTTIDILQALRGSIKVKTIDEDTTYQGTILTLKEEKPKGLRKKSTPKPETKSKGTMGDDFSKRNTELEKANDKLRDELAKQKKDYENKLKKKDNELAEFKQKKKEQDLKRKARLAKKETKEKEEKRFKSATPKGKLRILGRKIEKQTGYYEINNFPELDEVYEREFGKTIRQTIETLYKREVFPYLPAKMQDVVNTFRDETYLKANWKTFDKYLREALEIKELEKLIGETDTPVAEKLLERIKVHKAAPITIKTAKEMYDDLQLLQDIVEAAEERMSYRRVNEEVDKALNKASVELEELAKKRPAKETTKLTATTGKIENLKEQAQNAPQWLKTAIQAVMGGNPESGLKIIWDWFAEGNEKYMELSVKFARNFTEFVEKAPGGWKLVPDLDKDFAKDAKPIDTGITGSAPNGKKYETNAKLTKDIIMHIVASSKNQDNLMSFSKVLLGTDYEGKPVYSKPGGYVVPNQYFLDKGKIEEAYSKGKKYVFTMDEIKHLESLLTDTEKKFVEAALNVGKITAKEGNEVAQKLVGRDIFTVDNYIRIIRDPNTLNQDLIDPSKLDNLSNALSKEFVGLEGVLGRGGSLEARNHRSSRPIYGESLRQSVTNSFRGATKYISYAIPLYDTDMLLKSRLPDTFKKIGTQEQPPRSTQFMEYVKVDELPRNSASHTRYYIDNGNGYDIYEMSEQGKSLQQLIKDAGGEKFFDYYKSFTSNLIGQGRKYSPLSSLRAKVVLNANLRVAATQFFSYFQMGQFLEHPVSSMVKGIVDKTSIYSLAKEFLESKGEDLTGLDKRGVINKMWEEVTFLNTFRGLGYTTDDISYIEAGSSLLGRVNSGRLMKAVDRFTVDATFRALAEDLIARGYKFGTPEFFNAYKQNLFAIYQSNPQYARIYKTPLQNDYGAISTALSQFNTVMIEGYNNALQAAMAREYYKANGDKTNQKKWREVLTKSLLGLAASGAFLVLMKDAHDRLADKKNDESYGKKILLDWIQNVLSYTIVGDEIFAALINRNDYDITTNELSYAQNALDTLGYYGSAITSGKPSEWIKAIKGSLNVAGIPANGIENIMSMIGNATNLKAFKAYQVLKDSKKYEQYLKNEDLIDGDIATFYDMKKVMTEKVLTEDYGYIKGSKAKTYNSKGSAKARAIRDVLGFPKDGALTEEQSKEYNKWYEVFKNS